MAVNFPDNPVLNDEFSSSNRTWIWDGNVWLLKSSLPIAVSSLTDVELDGLTNGDSLVYNSTSEKWENSSIDALPSQTGNSGKYLTTDGSIASWATIDIPSTTVSENPPAGAEVGDTWFRSSTGQYFVYYDSYWIEVGAGPQGPQGEPGEPGIVSAVSPLSYDAEMQSISIDLSNYVQAASYQPTILSDTTPSATVAGTRWFKTTTGQEYIYYNSTWIEV